MFSKIPALTPTGMTLLLRAVNGEQITFTKFQVGDGVLTNGETPESRTSLKHVVIDNIPITSYVHAEENGYVQITGEFDNTDLAQEFVWREVGLFASDEQGNEYMYAYAYEPEYAELIHNTGDVSVLQTFSLLVYIGAAENVTVYVLPNASWATKQEFQAHVAARNPHNTLPSDIGAAAEEHTHNASLDITEGVLPVKYGGTGVTNLAALSSLLSGNYVIGIYVGDGKIRQDIMLGFTPTRVIVERVNTLAQYLNSRIYMFEPGKNVYHGGCGIDMATANATVLLSRGHGGGAVIDGGFAVGSARGVTVTTSNEAGIDFPQLNDKDHYMYIAFR